jgi:hypothetical protein
VRKLPHFASRLKGERAELSLFGLPELASQNVGMVVDPATKTVKRLHAKPLK